MTTTHRAHKVKTCPHCKAVAKARRDYGDPLGNTPPGDPRLPWPELVPILRPHVDPDNDTAIAALLKVDKDSVPDWRAKGIPFNTADAVAVRLALHPANIWPAECMALENVFRGCPVRDAELDALEAA